MALIERKTVRSSFDRAAATYDEWADLQRHLISDLMKILPERRFDSVLEIGCGTGLLTSFLEQEPGFRNVIATDISFNMLKKAGLKTDGKSVSFIAADAALLPGVLRGKFDLVISNSALHWLMDEFAGAMPLLFELMLPQGVFAASVFTKESLWELKTVLKRFTGDETTLPVDMFPSVEDVRNVLSGSLAQYHYKHLSISKTYPDLLSLMRALHRTGVTPLAGQRPLIFGSSGVKRIEAMFNEMCGRVRVSYDVVLFAGTGVKESRNPSARGMP
jgi:malonyl-CoA O-methyltransferase